MRIPTNVTGFCVYSCNNQISMYDIECRVSHIFHIIIIIDGNDGSNFVSLRFVILLCPLTFRQFSWIKQIALILLVNTFSIDYDNEIWTNERNDYILSRDIFHSFSSSYCESLLVKSTRVENIRILIELQLLLCGRS